MSWGLWCFSLSVQEMITSCGQVDSLSSFKTPHIIAEDLRLWKPAQPEILKDKVLDDGSPGRPNPQGCCRSYINHQGVLNNSKEKGLERKDSHSKIEVAHLEQGFTYI